MAVSTFSGPLIAFGQRPVINGMVQEYNPEAGPSLFYFGPAMLDQRFGYYEHSMSGYKALGFQGGNSAIPVLDVVPSTLATNNIAASQTVTAGTAMTLVSTTGAGVTVLAAALQVMPSLNTVPKNALALDGAPGIVTFGSSANIGLYDPTKAIARNVRITTNADDTGGTYKVVGYDIYGYPMSEAITGVNNGVASGKKAFKFITSVTPAGTLNSTAVIVGTGDVIGLPVRADTFGDIAVVYNNAVVTANTGFVTSDTTSPATTTTGDVRGTYALQTASNGTRRLQMLITPKLANMSTIGLFGVSQV